MNVLIYSGPGVSQISTFHTLRTLRTLLYPNYTVQLIHPDAVAKHPWPSQCALFVMPGGRDVPYLQILSNTGANERIKEYVENGGKYLGICAGA